METQKNDHETTGRRVDFRGSGVGNSGNLGADVRHSSESGYVVIAVLMMVFICLIVPLIAMLYLDTLNLQKKTERTEARIEKLVKDLEKKEK